MNQDLKTRWTVALCSGQYEQCRNYLHDDNDAHCCLGVLVRLEGGSEAFNELSRTKLLGKLVELNDELEWDFHQIAGWIDENIEVTA